VTLRTGRFGPYVQLGDGTKEEKPKRASIPKGVDANTVELAYALKLLSLPREVGLHPETGKPITAGLGRYGPFILHDGTYANLPTVEEVFDVGINRAVVLLAEKKAGGGKGRFQRTAPTVLKELGDHPSEGGKVQVLSGKYGPYVKHGDVNATLPRGREPADLTMEQAVELIAERAAKGPSKGKSRRARPAKKADDAPPAASGKAKSAKPKAKPKGKAKPAGTREAAE
jgi:DNA topoisomerase-1